MTQHDHATWQEPPVPTGSSTLLVTMWRHRVLVVVGTIMGAVLGWGLSSLQSPTYVASSQVFLSSHSEFNPLNSSDYVSDPSRYVTQQAAIIGSTPVLAGAISAGAPADNPTALGQRMQVIAAKDADILTVQATSPTAKDAVEIVDKVIAAYRSRVQAGVEAQVASMKPIATRAQFEQARRAAAVYGDGVSLVEPAAAVRASSAVRNGMLLGLAGLMLAVGLGLARDLLPEQLRRTSSEPAHRTLARPFPRRVPGSAAGPVRGAPAPEGTGPSSPPRGPAARRKPGRRPEPEAS